MEQEQQQNINQPWFAKPKSPKYNGRLQFKDYSDNGHNIDTQNN